MPPNKPRLLSVILQDCQHLLQGSMTGKTPNYQFIFLMNQSKYLFLLNRQAHRQILQLNCSLREGKDQFQCHFCYYLNFQNIIIQ